MDKSKKTVAEYLDKTLADSEKAALEDLLFSYKGILYPAAFCNLETFQVLDSFEARSDNVILAGYTKNGTNWLDQVLNDLEITAAKYTKEEINERMNIRNELSVFLRLEFGDPEKFKILLLVRNPKDTAVSYFHFHNNMPTLPSFSSWDEYFAAFMHGKICRGSYFDYLVEWNKHVDDENVMVITYEELKENQIIGLKKIADVFEFSLSEEEIQTVAEKSSFEAIKEKSFKTRGTFGKILFHKGIVGYWKDHFYEAQSKEMDRKFEECLEGTKLGKKMKYGVYCKA